MAPLQMMILMAIQLFDLVSVDDGLVFFYIYFRVVISR